MTRFARLLRRVLTTPSKTALTGLGLVLGLAAPASPARADFKATLTSLNPGQWTVDVQDSVHGNVSGYNYGAGQLNWTVNGASVGTLAGNGTNFGSFCIEIPKHVQIGTMYTFDAQSLGSLPTSLVPSMGDVKADQIRELWAERHASLSTGEQYAAFQLSIWEIIYETKGDLAVTGSTGGTFRAYGTPDNIVTLANTWLASVNGLDANGTAPARLANLSGMRVTINSGGDYQDQVVEVVAAPTPPALVLALLGIIPCLALRRRLAGNPGPATGHATGPA
jgi:hypothetical protein